ncbi:hypothetical protein [Streptomyces phaeochromogenes]|uniref:hypothetical protein n=1 Tax=Streptomyces phaeochromogenes TaxID=1923 RepID=UPI002DDB78E9|nr:hypothetical protein [Streptomyces phaeochromogenes]WRZ28737.1 hypothetical protein OG931_13725 [Streptomyces phaeochromogenes]
MAKFALRGRERLGLLSIRDDAMVLHAMKWGVSSNSDVSVRTIRPVGSQKVRPAGTQPASLVPMSKLWPISKRGMNRSPGRKLRWITVRMSRHTRSVGDIVPTL